MSHHKNLRNQKLTDKEIQTIKELKNGGVRISLIAKILEAEGMAMSAAYYHLSDNRKAYSNESKKKRVKQREYIQKRVSHLIDNFGMNTGQIAEEWRIDLATLNKIYTA